MESLPCGSETVLLVDADPEPRKLAAFMLQRRGYTVIEARSTADALYLCESWSARPDLLLTEILMPGMSGTDLAAKVVALQPELRVLFMSRMDYNRVARRQEINREWVSCRSRSPWGRSRARSGGRWMRAGRTARLRSQLSKARPSRDRQGADFVADWVHSLTVAARLSGNHTLNCTGRASFTAGFCATAPARLHDTAPSTLTSATASSGSPGFSGTSRRPSEKFAMLILFRPSTVPDVADDAGHVLILHEDQVAVERRFAVDAVHLREPRACPEAPRLPPASRPYRFPVRAGWYRCGRSASRALPPRSSRAAPRSAWRSPRSPCRGRTAQHAGQARIAQQVRIVVGDACRSKSAARLRGLPVAICAAKLPSRSASVTYGPSA